MRKIETEYDLKLATDELLVRDPRFAQIINDTGMPPLRHMPPGLTTLLRIITDQLISLAAGAAIWERLEAELTPFDPTTIIKKGEERLRKAGLTRAKAKAFVSAAAAARDGHLDETLLNRLDDDAVRRHLLVIPGVGPWTADIYLLSALGRTDAWPAGDMALRTAAADLFALKQRPSLGEMAKLAEPWRPLRSIAARLLWQHYRQIRTGVRHI